MERAYPSETTRSAMFDCTLHGGSARFLLAYLWLGLVVASACTGESREREDARWEVFKCSRICTAEMIP